MANFQPPATPRGLSATVSSCLGKERVWQTSRQAQPCALARISLCNTLKIAQPDDRSAPRRYGNILSSIVRQIGQLHHASTNLLAVPEHSSQVLVSNSGLITFGNSRGSLEAGILASLTRETSGSRAPAEALLKSSAEGSSGSAVALTSFFFRQRWNCRVGLSLRSERGSEWVHPSPGHGGGNCDDAVP